MAAYESEKVGIFSSLFQGFHATECRETTAPGFPFFRDASIILIFHGGQGL